MTTQKTFGAFCDELAAFAKEKWYEPALWLEEWWEMEGADPPGKDHATVKAEIRAQAFDQRLAEVLAAEMVWMFRQRMASICTDELYAHTGRDGHAFLKEITQRCAKAGFDVSKITGQPITPTEACVAAGIVVVNAKREVTPNV
jgi:hypothetical protein